MTSRLLPLLVAPLLVAGYFGAEFAAGRADASRILESETGPRGTSVTLLSRTHTLDRIYKSMQGPYETQSSIRLDGGDPESVLWVTGIETEVVDRDGATPISPEFFCHANLTLGTRGNGPESHNAAFGGTSHLDWRLFTLVPGRLRLHLPPGFGIPVRGGEPLDFLAMALNQNVTDRTVRARFRTRVETVSGEDAGTGMTPLFRRAVYGYEPLGVAAAGTACVGGSHPGESCGPFRGESASKHGFVESVGEGRTIHWLVSPGRYEARTDVTDQLGLPFDTGIHYATGHLHPFGVSLTLRDVTAGDTLLVIRSRDFEDRLGVAHMDEFASPEGVPIFRDHRYELVTVYDNTTAAPVDAMAILYLYCRDGSF